MKLEYRELLDDNNIRLQDLPLELRENANVVDRNLEKFQQNPDDEEFKKQLITQDVKLADMIQNWIEKEAEEYLEEKEEKERQINEANKKNLIDLQNNILNALDSEKRISVQNLSQLIGKQPDYPEQRVGDLVLRKVFIVEKYVLVNPQPTQ